MKKIFFLLSFFLPVFLFSLTSQFCTNHTINNYDTFVSGFVCNDIFYVTDGVVIYHDVNHLSQSYPPNVNVNVKSSDLITLTYGHSEGNDFIFNGYNYFSSTSCPDGTILNSSTGICETPDCPSGQHLLDGVCVADCNTTVPTTFGGYSYLADFTTSQEALDYVSSKNIQNGYIQSASSLGAPEYCTNFYVYGELPQNDPCLNVTPPLIINGFALHDTFTTFTNCTNFISNVAGGQGLCKQFDNCSKVFAYYNIDTNNTFIPDVNNTLPPVNDFISDNDSNYSAPAYIDDNNDSVDMSPVLNQLSDLSQKQHNDMKNLANKADVTNNNLNTISNKIDTTNNKLDSIDKKLSDLNGGNFLGDLSFTQMTDFYNNLQTDLASIDTQYNDFKNAISGGFDGYTISTGTSPIFTATVFGKTLTLDLCSTFSVFRPFVSFIFSALFLFLAIRIFWLGVKL